MKKTLLNIGLLLATIINCNAQWTPVTSGTTADFDDIHFLDSQNGYLGGGFSMTYKTVDGGSTWTATTSQGFRDYFFVDGTYGFAASIVGQSMGKTTNSGSSWTLLTPPTSNSLWGVAATSSLTAYFVGTGGVLWKTINGGTSFSVKNSGTTNLITDVWFTSASTGFLIGQSGGIRRTTDAGTTWSVVTTPPGLLTESCFLNASIGYVVGSNGLIVKTTDGGNTWTTQTTGTTSYLQSIHFFDVNNGIAVGSNGVILCTSDGGANWQSQNSGVTTMLTDVHMTAANKAVVVGDGGVILKNANIVVGIQDHQKTETVISVYPNPATDKVTVNSNSEMKQVEVFDLSGKLVYTSGKIYSNEHSADLSKLSAGQYVITISDANGKASQKLIK